MVFWIMIGPLAAKVMWRAAYLDWSWARCPWGNLTARSETKESSKHLCELQWHGFGLLQVLQLIFTSHQGCNVKSDKPSLLAQGIYIALLLQPSVFANKVLRCPVWPRDSASTQCVSKPLQKDKLMLGHTFRFKWWQSWRPRWCWWWWWWRWWRWRWWGWRRWGWRRWEQGWRYDDDDDVVDDDDDDDHDGQGVDDSCKWLRWWFLFRHAWSRWAEKRMRQWLQVST